MKFEQIENKLRAMIGMKPKSHKREKRQKTRYERRKANRDPETLPTYKKYDGWEF